MNETTDSAAQLAWSQSSNPAYKTFSMSTTTTITQLVFSYHRIITADDAGEILVFSTNGVVYHRFRGHGAAVRCIVATMERLVSGSDDSHIRVWDLHTGLCTHVFRGHEGGISALQIISPEPVDPPNVLDGQLARKLPIRPLILSGSIDHSARVWILPGLWEMWYGLHYPGELPPDPDAIANPFHKYHLKGHTGPVRCVAANRTTALTGGDDCTVRAYDIKENTLLYVLEGHTAQLTSVAIEPRLGIFYSASLDGHIRLWDATTGDCVSDCTRHSAAIRFMFRSYWRVFSGGEDGYCISWLSASRENINVYYSDDGPLCDLRGDDYKVITCTENSAKMWSSQDGQLLRVLLECRGQGKLSHVAYEGNQCALTHEDAQGYNMLTVIDVGSPNLWHQLSFTGV